MSAKITDAQLMKAVRLWGVFSNAKAALRLDMTERNFYLWINEAKRRGLVDASERHPRAINPSDLEKTFRACREHSTISAAAEALGITPKTVRARLRAAQEQGSFDERGIWSRDEDPLNPKKRATE
jgi:transposase